MAIYYKYKLQIRTAEGIKKGEDLLKDMTFIISHRNYEMSLPQAPWHSEVARSSTRKMLKSTNKGKKKLPC